MASKLTINKPKFNWDSKDKLFELQTFQEEFQIIFEGLYKGKTAFSKASLV